jgi:hypothetical protein
MVANNIAWCLRREYCLFLDDFSRLFTPRIYDRVVHSIGKTSFVILTRINPTILHQLPQAEDRVWSNCRNNNGDFAEPKQNKTSSGDAQVFGQSS